MWFHEFSIFKALLTMVPLWMVKLCLLKRGPLTTKSWRTPENDYWRSDGAKSHLGGTGLRWTNMVILWWYYGICILLHINYGIWYIICILWYMSHICNYGICILLHICIYSWWNRARMIPLMVNISIWWIFTIFVILWWYYDEQIWHIYMEQQYEQGYMEQG